MGESPSSASRNQVSIRRRPHESVLPDQLPDHKSQVVFMGREVAKDMVTVDYHEFKQELRT